MINIATSILNLIR